MLRFHHFLRLISAHLSFWGFWCIVVFKQLICRIHGFAAYARKLLPPRSCRKLKPFFHSSLHFLHVLNIISCKGTCKVKKSLRCLFYSPVSVLSDILLCLSLCSSIYSKVSTCKGSPYAVVICFSKCSNLTGYGFFSQYPQAVSKTGDGSLSYFPIM